MPLGKLFALRFFPFLSCLISQQSTLLFTLFLLFHFPIQENVIGWYKQRRNTDQQMTFRKQVVHENLKRAVSNQELIFLLLTPSEVTSSGSTHTLEYAVYRSHCRSVHSHCDILHTVFNETVSVLSWVL